MNSNTSINFDLKKEIASMPGGENVNNCFLCGTCTAGCPVSETRKDFSPREFMRKALLGLENELLASEEIWNCLQCHTCVAHCPQNACPGDVFRVIRELAEKHGYVKEGTNAEIMKFVDENHELYYNGVKAKMADRRVAGR